MQAILNRISVLALRCTSLNLNVDAFTRINPACIFILTSFDFVNSTDVKFFDILRYSDSFDLPILRLVLRVSNTSATLFFLQDLLD